MIPGPVFARHCGADRGGQRSLGWRLRADSPRLALHTRTAITELCSEHEEEVPLERHTAGPRPPPRSTHDTPIRSHIRSDRHGHAHGMDLDTPHSHQVGHHARRHSSAPARTQNSAADSSIEHGSHQPGWQGSASPGSGDFSATPRRDTDRLDRSVSRTYAWCWSGVTSVESRCTATRYRIQLTRHRGRLPREQSPDSSLSTLHVQTGRRRDPAESDP